MAAESPEKLLQLWKQEALTAEQAIGQLLQQVALLGQEVEALKKAVRALQQEHKR